MFPSDAEIMQFFSQYAYSPSLIYTAVIVMMVLSSFGLPLPEEVTILALGIIVYMGQNPLKYPPPAGMEGQALNLYTAMTVCFLAIFLSDMLVYYLGKYFGDRPWLHKMFKKFLGENSLQKCKTMIHEHRYIVPAIFRFTPGVRFPGHLSCGMLGISPLVFILADGTAALLSVPTQIYFFATYGEVILSTIKEIKQYLLIGGGVCLVFYLLYKYRHKFSGKKDQSA
jgi:membrane protein DedA with SNARE-associated domain